MLLLLTALTAHAQSPEAPAPTVVHAPQTAIDFEDLEIEGTLDRPSGAYVLSPRRADFNPMILLRTDFEAELAQSVAEVR